MNTKDLSLLEFPAVRNIIASHCAFSLSRNLALTLTPSDNIEAIQAGLTASAQASTLLAAEPSLSVSGLEDIGPDAFAAARGKTLEAKTLARIRIALDTLRLLRDRIVPHREKVSTLATLASAIGDFAPAINAITRAISPSGEILPNASPKLENIRRRAQDTRGALVDKLQSFIATDAERRFIQEPIVTEREGRYVVAVKSERRGEVAGIVHDVSNTGATIFVEPWQTLEMGNALKELQIEEIREIERILSEISAVIGSKSEAISASLQAAAVVDLELAKARYAARVGAIEPVVYNPSPEHPPIIRLVDARHPLLGTGAVPLNLELGKDFSTIIITGPNTGGKTVALKTIGLLCLMAQAGLPITAGPGTRLPVLTGIFADIGDEQSIQETLSTFGWHMSNISRILRELQGTSLVLFDELGASTDPQEGAALARSIIQHLLDHNILGAVTTHYIELKIFAHVTPRIQNASFSFDPNTLHPTYHLTLGTPGGSNAIATAASFGLPTTVIAHARESLSQGTREMESLLAGLQAERTRLNALTLAAEAEKTALGARSAELEREIKSLNTERQRIIQDARDNLVVEISRMQKEIKLAAAAIKRERSEAAVSQARRTIQTTREQLKKSLDSDKTMTLPAGNDGIIAVGDFVWLHEVGVEATVMSINERTGQIEVASGPLRFRINRESASKVTASRPERPAPPRNLVTTISVPSELDLRGRRAEEIEPLVDSYLGDAALCGRQSVRIIHGFGTGTVRSIIRDLAAGHPLVKSFHPAPPNEGGDGATIIDLK